MVSHRVSVHYLKCMQIYISSNISIFPSSWNHLRVVHSKAELYVIYKNTYEAKEINNHFTTY